MHIAFSWKIKDLIAIWRCKEWKDSQLVFMGFLIVTWIGFVVTLLICNLLYVVSTSFLICGIFVIKLFMFFLGLGPLPSYFILIFLPYCFSFVYYFVLMYLLSVVFVPCLLSFVVLNVALFIKLAIWLLTLHINKQELNWNQLLLLLLLLYYVRYNIATWGFYFGIEWWLFYVTYTTQSPPISSDYPLFLQSPDNQETTVLMF
jgi:hypothetical protein